MMLPRRRWSYDSAEHLITLNGVPAGTVLVRFGRA
jgi:hypothetical protein